MSEPPISEPAVKRTVVVANQQGLHLRVALMIVTEAKKFNAHVVLAKGLHQVDATEMFEVLSLGAARGEELSLAASGDDAQAAVDALEQLFLRKFDEE
jgi:phosphotransferase system HPr (HPr) family protein